MRFEKSCSACLRTYVPHKQPCRVGVMSKSQLTHLKPLASVFLTNLRLLDLDKRSDWPSTSSQLFLGKDAPRNQKNRVQFVEWALYRLFELWDPEETRNVSANYLYTLHEDQAIDMLLEVTIILPSHFDTSIYQSSHSTFQVAERPEKRWHTAKRCYN